MIRFISADTRQVSTHPWQQRLLGAALTIVALMSIFAFGGIILWGFKIILKTLAPVIWPLAIAGILALLLKPLVVIFEKYLKMSRIWAVLLLYLWIVGGILLLACLILPKLIDQAVAFLNFLPVLFDKSFLILSHHFPALSHQANQLGQNPALTQINSEGLKNIKSVMLAGLPILERAREGLVHAFAWATAFAVIPIYLFFFLQTKRDFLADIRQELTFIPASIKDDFIYLIHEFVNILLAFFRGQMIIGLSVGVLFSLGLSLVGLKFGMFLGLIIGCMNIIPYFGTILGLTTILPIAFTQPGGGMVLIAMILGVFSGVHLIEAYVLTPRIMGKRTGLHPAAIIFSIFFWGNVLGGILGMVLAIPLSAFVIIAWRLVKMKYLLKLFSQNACLPLKP